MHYEYISYRHLYIKDGQIIKYTIADTVWKLYSRIQSSITAKNTDAAM